MIYLVLLVLAGCAAPRSSLNLNSREHCTVAEVRQTHKGDKSMWTTECSEGVFIVFSKALKVGDQVEYSPFYVNNNFSVTYGYIHTKKRVNYGSIRQEGKQEGR